MATRVLNLHGHLFTGSGGNRLSVNNYTVAYCILVGNGRVCRSLLVMTK